MHVRFLCTIVLLAGLGADALPQPAIEETSLSVRENSRIVKDLVVVPSNDAHQLARRENPRFHLIEVAMRAAPLLPIFLGVFNLVTSIWNAAERCTINPLSLDCLFVAMDAVYNVWNSGFFANNGINAKRDAYYPPVHGIRDSAELPGPITRTEAHIPISPDQRLMHAAVATGNDGSWAHIATTYWGDEPAHHILYRVAHESDLGKPNDGSYHHFRCQPAPSQQAKLRRRAEGSKNGVVADYLWRDGNQQLYDNIEMGISNLGGVLGSNQANWMENNSAEASCASVSVSIPVADGSPPILREDQGVAAYGWNNTPFNFAGRAGGWVDECQT